MTSQQSADRDLSIWQANRRLPPEARIQALLREFFAPPRETDEYEITLRNIALEMAA
jgi:hypothetical protein